MSNTTITYNRSKKQYEVHNGRFLEAFPAGPAGQQAASQCALKQDDRHAYGAAFYLVFDLFRNSDKSLHERIWRGAAIVAAGDVRPPYAVGESRFTVARIRAGSKNNTPEQGRHYIITRSPNRLYSCECFDFQNAAPRIQGQKLCKHILALKITKIINRELPAWPEKEIDPRKQWLINKDHLAGVKRPLRRGVAKWSEQNEKNAQYRTARGMRRLSAQKAVEAARKRLKQGGGPNYTMEPIDLDAHDPTQPY